jgi:hypothetical protein
VQQVRDYHASKEFKLAGHPWWADGRYGLAEKLFVTFYFLCFYF